MPFIIKNEKDISLIDKNKHIAIISKNLGTKKRISVIKKLLDYKPDIVGIANNYTNSVNDVLEICQTVKKNLPICKVVVGGSHSTIAHK